LKEEESELQPEGSNGEEVISESSDHIDFFDYFYVVVGVIGFLYTLHSILTWEMCIAIGHNTC
jgi:hypothetical protein